LKRLVDREGQLKKAVDNLLNLAESGSISSDALSKRLARNESVLAGVQRELTSLSVNGRRDFKFKREMVMERLGKIAEVVRSGRANVRETQAVLKKLYPEKLRVYARKLEGRMVFRITGKTVPLNLTDEEDSPIIENGGGGSNPILALWHKELRRTVIKL
jgi:hypothetical protein